MPPKEKDKTTTATVLVISGTDAYVGNSSIMNTLLKIYQITKLHCGKHKLVYSRKYPYTDHFNFNQVAVIWKDELKNGNKSPSICFLFIICLEKIIHFDPVFQILC